MPSSYTTRNRAEKQGVGENSNAWGGFLNSDTIDMFDEALDGVTSFTLSTTKTLTTNNGATDEARKRVLNITGGSGGTVTIPNLEKTYLVRNASSGNVIFTTGTGTTATVSSGAVVWIFCDGANAVLQEVQPISAGGTGATTASGARTNLGVTATGSDTAYAFRANNLSDLVNAGTARTNLGLATIAASGSAADLSAGTVPAARMPALTGDITTSAGAVATTLATVNGNVGSFGTASAIPAITVNAKGLVTAASTNAVSVNNGNWSGTALAVANGGTGATTAAAARTNVDTPHAIAMFCGGVPGASEQIGGMISPWTFSITQANCSFKAGTAATASTTITIKKNGSSIGTAVFAISGTTATVTITTAAVTAGDLITFHAPSVADASLADISGLLKE